MFFHCLMVAVIFVVTSNMNTPNIKSVLALTTSILYSTLVVFYLQLSQYSNSSWYMPVCTLYPTYLVFNLNYLITPISIPLLSIPLVLITPINTTCTNTTFAQSAGTVEYTNCFSAEGLDPTPMSVLDMTLNYLMMRFQPWSFGECGVPLHCHCSQIHSGLES